MGEGHRCRRSVPASWALAEAGLEQSSLSAQIPLPSSFGVLELAWTRQGPSGWDGGLVSWSGNLCLRVSWASLAGRGSQPNAVRGSRASKVKGEATEGGDTEPQALAQGWLLRSGHLFPTWTGLRMLLTLSFPPQLSPVEQGLSVSVPIGR